MGFEAHLEDVAHESVEEEQPPPILRPIRPKPAIE